MRLAFDDCVLDPERRWLERGGNAVHLSPKAYALLAMLVDQRPRALGREELCAAIWPGQFVSDSSLTNAVTQLREALGDRDREPPLVRTVHRYGYAFDGEVRVIEAVAPAGLVCLLQWDGREVMLGPGEHVLGRSPQAAVWLHDRRVSRRHARITVADGSALLEDLGSRNGTLRGGARIDAPVALADGDEIGLGSASIMVRFGRAGSTLTGLDASGSAVYPPARRDSD